MTWKILVQSLDHLKAKTSLCADCNLPPAQIDTPLLVLVSLKMYLNQRNLSTSNCSKGTIFVKNLNHIKNKCNHLIKYVNFHLFSIMSGSSTIITLMANQNNSQCDRLLKNLVLLAICCHALKPNLKQLFCHLVKFRSQTIIILFTHVWGKNMSIFIHSFFCPPLCLNQIYSMHMSHLMFLA